jgi:hypothetical protein
MLPVPPFDNVRVTRPRVTLRLIDGTRVVVAIRPEEVFIP